MEDVLDVYHRPPDPKRPLVCPDEASEQLIGETAEPVPAEPGRPERFDSESVRNGTANPFMISEPLAGRRSVTVTDRRTAKDFAEVLRRLADEVHPTAEKIVLVMDNLNAHTTASLDRAFAPKEARRLAERFEIHHTPKYGSWLNVAGIELSVLSRQCLSRRIESMVEFNTPATSFDGAKLLAAAENPPGLVSNASRSPPSEARPRTQFAGTFHKLRPAATEPSQCRVAAGKRSSSR